MARFEVHYSFTCKKCSHKNENRILMTAPDTLSARDFTLVSSQCSECNVPVDPTQPFTANIKDVK